MTHTVAVDGQHETFEYAPPVVCEHGNTGNCTECETK